jgi:hypothetical protein
MGENHFYRIAACAGPSYRHPRGRNRQSLSLPAGYRGHTGGRNRGIATRGLSQCSPRKNGSGSMLHHPSAMGGGATNERTTALRNSVVCSMWLYQPHRSLGLEGGATVTNCQRYAPWGHDCHSGTVDHHHNRGNGVCYVKEMKTKLLQFHLQVIVSGLLLLI